jgi:hypothetical protein
MTTTTHDHRLDPAVRDLARFAAEFAEHHGPADVQELHRRAMVALRADTTDLSALGALYEDKPENRTELVRSAKEVLAQPVHPMTPESTRSIGVFLCILGAALLATLLWAWSLASRVLEQAPGETVEAEFLGLGFRPTAEFALVGIVVLTAMLGSFVVMTQVFAARAGHKTLEQGFVWWYLTRPLIAAALAFAFYMTVVAGYFNDATRESRPALVVAAVAGGLTGLFTDQVLDKLRGVLGLMPYRDTASGTDPGAEGSKPA